MIIFEYARLFSLKLYRKFNHFRYRHNDIKKEILTKNEFL